MAKVSSEGWGLVGNRWCAELQMLCLHVSGSSLMTEPENPEVREALQLTAV